MATGATQSELYLFMGQGLFRIYLTRHTPTSARILFIVGTSLLSDGVGRVIQPTL